MILRMMLARAHRMQPAFIEAPKTEDVLAEARKKTKLGLELADGWYGKIREALK